MEFLLPIKQVQVFLKKCIQTLDRILQSLRLHRHFGGLRARSRGWWRGYLSHGEKGERSTEQTCNANTCQVELSCDFESNAINPPSLRYPERNVEQRSSAPVTPSFVSERKRISHFRASSSLLCISNCVSFTVRDCFTRYQNHRFLCGFIPGSLVLAGLNRHLRLRF